MLLHPTARAVEHRRLLDRAWADTVRRATAALPPGDAGVIRAAAPALQRLVRALEPGSGHGASPP